MSESVKEHVIAGRRLTCAIANCHRMLRHRYRKSPLWALVSDITGHGSGHSIEICLQCGYDPHGSAGLKTLKLKSPPG